MSSVGERIKARRLELRWTQEKLAETAKISTGFLSDLETGKRNVSADYLLEIAQALGVTTDFLMIGDRSESKATNVSIPDALSDLARQENLTFSQTLMLLDMRRQIKAHRSNAQPANLETFDWKKFYEAVKPFLK